jgi:hypothetical protein
MIVVNQVQIHRLASHQWHVFPHAEQIRDINEPGATLAPLYPAHDGISSLRRANTEATCCGLVFWRIAQGAGCGSIYRDQGTWSSGVFRFAIRRQIAYAGMPRQTIPRPTAERPGWVAIVLTTNTIAAAIKTIGVNG